VLRIVTSLDSFPASTFILFPTSWKSAITTANPRLSIRLAAIPRLPAGARYRSSFSLETRFDPEFQIVRHFWLAFLNTPYLRKRRISSPYSTLVGSDVWIFRDSASRASEARSISSPLGLGPLICRIPGALCIWMGCRCAIGKPALLLWSSSSPM